MTAPTARLKNDWAALLPAAVHADLDARLAALAEGGADFLGVVLAQGLAGNLRVGCTPCSFRHPRDIRLLPGEEVQTGTAERPHL